MRRNVVFGMLVLVGLGAGGWRVTHPPRPTYAEFSFATDLVIKAEFQTTLMLSSEELDAKDRAYALVRRWCPQMCERLRDPGRTELNVKIAQFGDSMALGYYDHNGSFTAKDQGHVPDEALR